MGTYRYSLATRISADGNTLAHGLPGTPDEYFAAMRVAPGASGVYFLGVSSTNVVVACAVGAGSGVSAVIFAAVNHSLIA
jgi:hypothetical protein